MKRIVLACVLASILSIPAATAAIDPNFRNVGETASVSTGTSGGAGVGTKEIYARATVVPCGKKGQVKCK